MPKRVTNESVWRCEESKSQISPQHQHVARIAAYHRVPLVKAHILAVYCNSKFDLVGPLERWENIAQKSLAPIVIEISGYVQHLESWKQRHSVSIAIYYLEAY